MNPSLTNPDDLKHEIKVLTDELDALRQKYERLVETQLTISQMKHRDRLQLEQLVVERTRELSDSNARLLKEMAERKEAENQARQHQERLAHVARLNTVGEMASGLAHEINQPLAAIASYTQGCLHRLRTIDDPEQLGPQLEPTLQQIVVQAQRAASIVQHLRNFVVKGKPHRETTDIGNIVRLAVRMVRNLLMTHQITLNITQAENLPAFEADPIQIEQVLLNMLRNATEAMRDMPPERRRLDIEVSTTENDSGETTLLLAIHDTGPGIARGDEDKLSTPFFSTKADGMGLGLAISRTIVEDHGGRLSYYTNKAGGATFTFTLALGGRRNAV